VLYLWLARAVCATAAVRYSASHVSLGACATQGVTSRGWHVQGLANGMGSVALSLWVSRLRRRARHTACRARRSASERGMPFKYIFYPCWEAGVCQAFPTRREGSVRNAQAAPVDRVGDARAVARGWGGVNAVHAAHVQALRGVCGGGRQVLKTVGLCVCMGGGGVLHCFVPLARGAHMCQVTHRLGALLTTYPPPPPPHAHAPYARQRGHQHTRAPTPRTQGRASTHRATPQHAHNPHARAHTRTLYHTIHARAHTPCYTTTHTMPLSHTWAHARTHAHKQMDARVFSGSKPLNKQERVVTTGAWQ